MRLNAKHILPLLIAFVLVGCNEEKIAQLEKQNKELQAESASKDSTMNQMMATFSKIQTNLQEIKNREGIIEINTAEGEAPEVGESINNDINAINNLMQENEKLLTDLNQRLSKSNVQVAEFKNLVKNLNNRVQAKNKEIESLSTELQSKKILIGKLYFKNDSLQYTNKLKEKQLENKIDEINRAYYAFGTFKELKEQNVLTKDGGFLGIGKTEGLKNNFNTDYFSTIDITKQTSFLLYAKKAEVVTTHPKNSYKIMGKDDAADSLVITNPEEFWKATKYLVVVVD